MYIYSILPIIYHSKSPLVSGIYIIAPSSQRGCKTTQNEQTKFDVACQNAFYLFLRSSYKYLAAAPTSAERCMDIERIRC